MNNNDRKPYTLYDPYAQFELALQQACIERNIPVLIMGWDSMIENFHQLHQENGKKIYGGDWEYDDAEELEWKEILVRFKEASLDEDKKGSLLDHFFKYEANPIRLYFSAYDPSDCEYCGSSNITAQIKIDPRANTDGSDKWQADLGFGCYGGDGFSGDKEDCIAFLRINFKDLIHRNPDIHNDEKRWAKEFLSDLDKFEVAIPTTLPER